MAVDRGVVDDHMAVVCVWSRACMRVKRTASLEAMATLWWVGGGNNTHTTQSHMALRSGSPPYVILRLRRKQPISATITWTQTAQAMTTSFSSG